MALVGHKIHFRPQIDSLFFPRANKWSHRSVNYARKGAKRDGEKERKKDYERKRKKRETKNTRDGNFSSTESETTTRLFKDIRIWRHMITNSNKETKENKLPQKDTHTHTHTRTHTHTHAHTATNHHHHHHHHHHQHHHYR